MRWVFFQISVIASRSRGQNKYIRDITTFNTCKSIGKMRPPVQRAQSHLASRDVILELMSYIEQLASTNLSTRM